MKIGRRMSRGKAEKEEDGKTNERQIQFKSNILADDTKLYNKTSNNGAIQNDIFSLQEWSNKWDLHFNMGKCGVLHAGKANNLTGYWMKVDNDFCQIQDICEENFKDLGVI